MKPYPNYKGHKLKDINPTAIALVTEGANRKKFFLSKLKQGDVSMKKETALGLIKSGNLSDSEFTLVIADVADGDKVEVQKAYDDLKKSITGDIDLEKLATSIADKIVKSQEPALREIADNLKATTTHLEKLAGTSKIEGSIEDKELTQAELDALVNAEMGKE